MSPIICFITGPCAAGKSTVGKLLAKDKHFMRAMLIETDAFRRMVWQGYVPPFPESSASREQLVLAAKATARVAKLYYGAGFHVFIEDVLEPWLLPTYRKELRGCRTKTFCILPSKAELLKRDKSRSKSEQVGKRCLGLRQSFEEWSLTEDWIVIGGSDKQKPKETVEQLLLHLRSHKAK